MPLDLYNELDPCCTYSNNQKGVNILAQGGKYITTKREKLKAENPTTKTLLQIKTNKHRK